MRIITHKGGAHRDELLAIAILLAFNDAAVEDVSLYRTDPTEGDLADKNTWVIDVGMRHEPDLRNFDHHQLPRDADPTCAMSLIAEHLGVDTVLSKRPWYHVTKVLDSKGPFALAGELGLPRFPNELLSPVELTLLKAFEETTGDSNVMNAEMVGIIKDLGRGILLEAEEFSKELVRMSSNTELMYINKVPALVTLDEPHAEALGAFRDALQDREDLFIGINIAYDDRGEGWMLYRFDDHPAVDFSKLEGDDRILFSHPGGFIAKTKERMELDDVLALAAKAVDLIKPGSWHDGKGNPTD